MRRVTSFLAVLAAFAVTFQAGAWYYQRATVAAASAPRKVLRYICPMHPQYTSDAPGTAPCCGMQLEPVYARGGEEAGAAPADEALPPAAVRVSAQQQEFIGVRVQSVAPAAGGHGARLPGRVVPDERLVYSLNAGLEGTIRDVSDITTGARVRRHQVLATYTAPDVLLAVQSYILALDGLDKLRAGRARDAQAHAHDGPEPGLPPIMSRTETGMVVNSGSSNFQQRVDRLQLLGMSDVQIDEIRRMRDVPYQIKIVAPADGTVLARNVRPGWKFARGEEWFRIADLRRVWILADVPGANLGDVRPGQPVRVSVPEQGLAFEARVSAVVPQFDPESRTYKLRLEADNPGEVLRPDMFVDVDLPTAASPALAVPVDAVVDTGLRKSVFVEHAPGVFVPREVHAGRRHGGTIEILHGLTAGERIAVSGTFMLDSESRLRGASPVAAVAEHHHGH
jgi:Cu(I)/Ag(I) efflux system membrane fusion protein